MNYKKLIDVCEITMGQSPNSSFYNKKGEGIPFYQGKTDFGDIYPTPRMYCSRPLRVADKHDILMSVRAPVGDVNIAQEECCIGRGVAAIRAKDLVDYKYLYYILDTMRERIEVLGTGSTFKAITKKSLENIRIPVPPRQIQHKVIDLFDLLNNVINKRKQQIEALSTLKHSIFSDMFGDSTSNIKDFVKVELGKHAHLVTSGSTPRGGSESYLKEGIPLIRSQNVRWNQFALDNVVYISEDVHEGMKRSQLLNKDVLFNITGASIGRSVVFEGPDNSANVNQHVSIIRLKDNLNPYYLSYLLTSDDFQLNVVSKNIGATRQAFNFTQIKAFKIMVPKIELQIEFEKKIKAIDNQLDLMTQNCEELLTLYNSLMQKAFNGELFDD